MKVLVFLRWPERCFRANESDLEYLRSLLPRSAEVIETKTERTFLKELPTATHAIVWYFKPEWFARAPRLKALATPAAGRELVPTQGPAGVRIHFGGFHGPIIAESVAAFMMAWSRGFFLPQIRSTPWPRVQISDSIRELAGTSAVILGYGRIGRTIGAKLESLGVRVHGVTRHNGGVPRLLQRLEQGLSPSKRGLSPSERGLSPSSQRGLSPFERGLSPDWLILALPSDTGTDNLVNAELLSKLPKKCVLINIGRGNSVDEVALARALRRGKLAGAYLDVLKYEPRYRRSPAAVDKTKRASLAFIKGTVPHSVVTPHASAFSPRYVKDCFDELKKDDFWR